MNTPLSFFANYKFTAPSKRIKNASDITTFVSSESYTTLLSFIRPLARAVQGQTINADEFKRRASPAITKLLSMLNRIDGWTHAINHSQDSASGRRVHSAYRAWLQKIREKSILLITCLLPNAWSRSHSTILDNMVMELRGYFESAFENGVEHELNFLCFLLLLHKLRVLRRAAFKLVVLGVFNKYKILMRKVRRKLGIFFPGFPSLVFFFGAAQLVGHAAIKPPDILN